MRPEAERRLSKQNGTDTAAWGRVDRDSSAGQGDLDATTVIHPRPDEGPLQ